MKPVREAGKACVYIMYTVYYTVQLMKGELAHGLVGWDASSSRYRAEQHTVGSSSNFLR